MLKKTMTNWPIVDPEDDEEGEDTGNNDDCVDDINHDSDFPLLELPPGELNRYEI